MVVAILIWRPVSLPKDEGLGIWSLIFAGLATALSRFSGPLTSIGARCSCVRSGPLLYACACCCPRVLPSDMSRQASRINGLQADIGRLSARQQKLQASLDAKREELAAVQRKLRAERARLTRLRARLVVVRRTLAQRLLDLYEGGDPDLIGVVLNANGFEDLLSRTEFMARISRQDAK